MTLRKLHRMIAVVFAPFILLTAITGGMLLWRHTGAYEFGTMNVLFGLHNWEIVANYVGTILAVGMMVTALTGLTLWAQVIGNKRRAAQRKAKKK